MCGNKKNNVQSGPVAALPALIHSMAGRAGSGTRSQFRPDFQRKIRTYPAISPHIYGIEFSRKSRRGGASRLDLSGVILATIAIVDIVTSHNEQLSWCPTHSGSCCPRIPGGGSGGGGRPHQTEASAVAEATRKGHHIAATRRPRVFCTVEPGTAM